MNVFLLLAASQAWSGVPYDEATLLEMADVVVEGEVVNAVCRSEIEDRFSRVTVVESTVSVESVVKGDVEESITVQSTMTEYKKSSRAARMMVAHTGLVRSLGSIYNKAMVYLSTFTGRVRWTCLEVIRRTSPSAPPATSNALVVPRPRHSHILWGC